MNECDFATPGFAPGRSEGDPEGSTNARGVGLHSTVAAQPSSTGLCEPPVGVKRGWRQRCEAAEGRRLPSNVPAGATSEWGRIVAARRFLRAC